MQLASLFVTAWLLALPSAAQEECADRISLKNWRFCDGSGGCDFPDDTWQLDVDPWSPRSGAAIIEEHQVYDIQWENADPDYGVMVSWAFPPPSIANVTRPSDYYGYWLANTTGDNYLFHVASILTTFPNEQLNISRELAENWSRRSSYLRFSQPNKTDGRGNQCYFTTTGLFSVQNRDVTRALRTQETLREQEVKRWRLGVGVGVGVGVPVLMAATAVATWCIMRRSSRQKQAAVSK